MLVNEGLKRDNRKKKQAKNDRQVETREMSSCDNKDPVKVLSATDIS